MSRFARDEPGPFRSWKGWAQGDKEMSVFTAAGPGGGQNGQIVNFWLQGTFPLGARRVAG